MSWLRLDDGFTKHPKFEGWTPAEKWSWLEAMEYCARYDTNGRVPPDLSLLPRSVNAKILAKAERSEWCFRGQDGALWINDWDIYNPPKIDGGDLEELVQQLLADDPSCSANDVVKLTGGRRRDVLALVKRYRKPVPKPVPQVVPGTTPELVSRADTRPVPSLNVKDSPTTVLDIRASTADVDTPDHEHLQALLDQIGVHDGLRVAAMQDPARAHAWALKALVSATSSPAGFFRSTFETGRWPAPPEPVRAAPMPPCVSCGVGGGLHVAECPTASVPPEDESEADAA